MKHHLVPLPDDWNEAVYKAAKRKKMPPDRWIRLVIFRALPARVRGSLSPVLEQPNDRETKAEQRPKDRPKSPFVRLD